MSEVWSNCDRYYEGYWQNWEYFIEAQTEVRSTFTFKKNLSGEMLK